MRRILFALVCAVSMSGVAYADDFTFTVPVRIENMNHAPRAQVFCDVFRDATQTTATRVGEGRSDSFAVTGGDYRGDVRVVIRLGTGVRRDSVRSWSCRLGIWVQDADGSSALRVNALADYPRITGQAIASSQRTVTGAVPPP